MPVVIKMIKKKENEENEINFYNNELKENITEYLNTYIDTINQNEKILYFSFYASKKSLIENYNSFNRNNIVVIATHYFRVDNLENYIIKQKPKYIFINYYKLISNQGNLFVMKEKLRYVFDKINEYSEKYEVKFIVAINKENIK